MKFVKCVLHKNILILYIIMTEFVEKPDFEKPKFITKLAEEKFLLVQQAYENIMKSRT